MDPGAAVGQVWTSRQGSTNVHAPCLGASLAPQQTSFIRGWEFWGFEAPTHPRLSHPPRPPDPYKHLRAGVGGGGG